MAKYTKVDKSNPVITIAAVVVILVGVMAMLSLGPFSASVATPPVKDDTVVDAGEVSFKCESSTTPDYDLNGYDMENRGTAITGDGLYNIDGTTAWNAFTIGTAITNLPVGAKVNYALGNTASDWTDNPYGPVGFFVVPCAELTPEDVGMYNDAVEGAVTTTFYYPVGHASSISMSADTSYVFEIATYANTDLVFGNPFSPDPYPNMLNAHVNSTHGDKPDWVKVNGIEMDEVNCGTLISAAAGYKDYCYELPVITESQVTILVSYNTDDTNAPASDETWNIYSGGHYLNSDTGLIEWGRETEDGSAVGNADAETVTMDFTP